MKIEAIGYTFPKHHPKCGKNIIAMRKDGFWFGGEVDDTPDCDDGFATGTPYVDTGIDVYDLEEGTIWFDVEALFGAAKLAQESLDYENRDSGKEEK